MVAQLAKHLPAMQETPVQFLGQEDSPGEGRGYSLQYSWPSVVARMVKNPLAMRETWARSLGWKDPLEKGKTTHSSILPWRIPMDRGVWQAVVRGVTKSRTQLSDEAQHSTEKKHL